MARELRTSYGSGANVYAVIRSITDDKVWATDSAAFETWTNADIANYAVALTDRGGDLYSANLPSGLSASTPYRVFYYVRAGATPTISDTMLESVEGATEPPVPVAVTGSITAADVIALVRKQLKDEESSDPQWPDEVLLEYVNAAQADICGRRRYELLSDADTLVTMARVAATTDSLSLGVAWKQAMADYVCGRAMSEDHPEANATKAKTFFQLYEASVA